MNFLALLIGLGLERVLTHFFHLRAFHWLDPLFDRVLARLAGYRPGLSAAGVAGLALLLTAPVGWASMVLSVQSVQWPYFLFAIVVLLFSLGPRDLQEEVEEYCAATQDAGGGEAQRLACELLGFDPGAGTEELPRQVHRAIFVQANNRIFGVVFWFLVLGPAGPAGAWLFRVLDLLRQRALARQQAVTPARQVHGLAAWLPGRLMVGAFALAGNFMGAIAGWRAAGAGNREAFFQRTETRIAGAGEGACRESGPAASDEGAAGLARQALGLVRRALWLIWYPLVALLTLNNWLR